MEPCGCNRWQPVANRTGAKTANQAKTVAVGCDHLPQRAHGKERDILASLPNARVRVLDCGPEIPMELPAELANVIEQFLAGLP